MRITKKENKLMWGCFKYGNWIMIFNAFSKAFPHLTKVLCKDFLSKNKK